MALLFFPDFKERLTIKLCIFSLISYLSYMWSVIVFKFCVVCFHVNLYYDVRIHVRPQKGFSCPLENAGTNMITIELEKILFEETYIENISWGKVVRVTMVVSIFTGCKWRTYILWKIMQSTCYLLNWKTKPFNLKTFLFTIFVWVNW